MENVLVLMSTYNGSRFLNVQIESIMTQKDVIVKVLVRDDGSSDETLSILKKWKETYPNNIEFYQGRNIGPARSFLELLEKSTVYPHKYIAFCDQDDVWLPNKLNKAINCIPKGDIVKECLYLGSYQMTDSKLNPIYTPYCSPRIGVLEAMIDNVATGCTMVMNKALVNRVISVNFNLLLMHDDWVYKIATAVNADIIFDDEKLMLYRQHGMNVIGGIRQNFKEKWTGRFKKLFYPDNLRVKVVSELITQFGNNLPPRNKILLTKLANYKKGLNRFYFLGNHNFRGQNLEGTLRAKFMILFGQF